MCKKNAVDLKKIFEEFFVQEPETPELKALYAEYDQLDMEMRTLRLARDSFYGVSKEKSNLMDLCDEYNRLSMRMFRIDLRMQEIRENIGKVERGLCNGSNDKTSCISL